MRMVNLVVDWAEKDQYPAGAVIFSEGSAADFMCVVIEGEVQISLNGEHLGTEV